MMNPVTNSIFALFLLLGPPEDGSPPAESSYEHTIEQLSNGINLGDEQPKEAISILEPALAAIPEYAPQLANDPGALALRAEAYVSLARAYLTVRDEAKARAALDEGARSAPFGEELPVIIYGPKVEKLWKQKLKQSEAPRQDVVVNCWAPCRVYLNERSIEAIDASEREDDEFAVQARFVGLTPGTYRLWIESTDGSDDPLITTFDPPELDAPPLEFIFGTKPAPKPKLEAPKPAPVKPPAAVKPDRKRLLPLPVEVSAIAAGVGLIAAGAVLFVIDGKCTNDATVKGAVPADGSVACPTVWTTGIAGLALMGSGAGLAAAGSILLGIDEVRAAKDKKAARIVVGWQFRF